MNNMIVSFEEFINEGTLWGKSFERGSSTSKRIENGRKVMTKYGVPLYLKNTSINYDEEIDYIINDGDGDGVVISTYRSYYEMNDKQKLEDLMNNKLPYDQVIEKKTHMIGESLIAEYSPYDDFRLAVDEIEYDEDDYISMCTCVTEILRKHSKNIDIYKGDGVFLILDETSVYYWTIDNVIDDYDNKDDDDSKYYADEWWSVFKEYMYEECPDFSDSMINYTYRDGINIAMKINTDTILNFDKYYNTVRSWFGIEK